MAQSISMAVGIAAPNNSADVIVVQTLLNLVPAGEGGPAAPLVVDGMCGMHTNGAIRMFQQRKHLTADSRVDPNGRTLAALNTYNGASPGGLPPGVGSVPKVGGGLPPGVAPTTTIGPPELSNIRKRILQIAFAAARPPFGIVNDVETAVDPVSGRQIRAGWARLKEFMDKAWDGWSEGNWEPKVISKDPAMIQIKTKEDALATVENKVTTNWEGIMLPTHFMRGQQMNSDRTEQKFMALDWCGVFAVWCYIEAGVTVKWRTSVGPSLPLQKDKSKLQPGDIAFIARKNHHFIVAGIDGDNIISINGNSMNQGITIGINNPDQSKRNILGYYSPPDAEIFF